jgi:hypothetical protein
MVIDYSNCSILKRTSDLITGEILLTPNNCYCYLLLRMMHGMAVARPLLWPIKCREVASGKLLNYIWYVHFRSSYYLIGHTFIAFK